MFDFFSLWVWWLWWWIGDYDGGLIFYFVCGFGCVWWWWWWRWLMVEVVVDGAGLFFLGSGIYYFIVGGILFYCDVYIILLR